MEELNRQIKDLENHKKIVQNKKYNSNNIPLKNNNKRDEYKNLIIKYDDLMNNIITLKEYIEKKYNDKLKTPKNNVNIINKNIKPFLEDILDDNIFIKKIINNRLYSILSMIKLRSILLKKEINHLKSFKWNKLEEQINNLIIKFNKLQELNNIIINENIKQLFEDILDDDLDDDTFFIKFIENKDFKESTIFMIRLRMVQLNQQIKDLENHKKIVQNKEYSSNNIPLKNKMKRDEYKNLIIKYDEYDNLIDKILEMKYDNENIIIENIKQLFIDILDVDTFFIKIMNNKLNFKKIILPIIELRSKQLNKKLRSKQLNKNLKIKSHKLEKLKELINNDISL